LKVDTLSLEGGRVFFEIAGLRAEQATCAAVLRDRPKHTANANRPTHTAKADRPTHTAKVDRTIAMSVSLKRHTP
jgi:hypothetical protein